MRYISTRGEAPHLDFTDALLAGLARDGGLYVPESWPQFSPQTFAAMAGRPYHEIAVEVLRPFIAGTIAEADVARMAREAYAGFGHRAVTPLVQIGPDEWVLELFHGPTLAFKDCAMQLLGKLMDHVLAKRGARATVVGATSGDTGGAAVEAFRHSQRVDMVVLFPTGRVSDVQRRMMTTTTEANIHALSIAGTFDDCQAIVKGMFDHHAFRDRVQLSGVNSINWARIVAQVVYYVVAAVAMGAPQRRLAFAVPTGNFGDVFAGYVAKRLGLPIETLIVGTNINDILARTLETGLYEVRGVEVTTSPSMDIQVSSNFERLLYDATGRDAATVRAAMGSLKQSGRFTLDEKPLAAIRADFQAHRTDEAEVAALTRETLAQSGYLLDPHTAVGLGAGRKAHREKGTPLVVLATAHPAKFPDAVHGFTGVVPALPPRLSTLMTDPERMSMLPADRSAVEHYILTHTRAASVAA